MAKTTKTAPRSNAERTAVSRIRIVTAAVRALCKLGYGETTVSVIVESAGVSRGALLHHFPTKATLMRAVVQHAWNLDSRYYRFWLARHPDPRTRFINIVDPAWKAMSRSTGVAVAEILIACRSDSSLAREVVPAQREIWQHSRALLRDAVTHGLGFSDADTDSFLDFMVAVVRGLVLDVRMSGNDSIVQPALAHVKARAEQLLP